MNFQSLRRLQLKLSVAFVAAATLVLTSCGGGGATSSPTSVGSLQLLPGTLTIYAGVPYKMNIVGGRKPYLVTSSEPTLVELNFTTDSSEFSFVARNPGVIDVGLDPNAVPSRTVNIEVRDSNGTSISNAYNVLQNFFTGYHEGYQNTCLAPSTGTPPQACSGTDSIVTLYPVSNGTLYGNREFQFDKVRGDYSFVVEDPSVTPQLVDRIRVRTDQVGKANVRLRVTTTAVTQLASYKVTDIATGVTTDMVFMIVQQAPADAISILPNTITFTGGLTTRCGYGTADVFVFGGVPPYTVTSSSGLAFSPATLAASGARLAITAPLSTPPCVSGALVIVTDSRGATALVTVNTVAGSTPPQTLSAAPTTIDSLLCGQSAQVVVIGGLGNLWATSQHPRINATASGSTVTLTRQTGDLLTDFFPNSGSVVVTDGASLVTIAVTYTPPNCP